MGEVPPLPETCARKKRTKRSVSKVCAPDFRPPPRVGQPRPRARRCARSRSPSDFSSWQSSHKPCSFVSSSAPPSLNGTLWSRCVARRTRPFSSHRTHSGFAVNRRARAACSLRPVMRLGASTFFAQSLRGCFGHRPVPSRTRTPQPGWLHGLGGAIGMEVDGAGSNSLCCRPLGAMDGSRGRSHVSARSRGGKSLCTIESARRATFTFLLGLHSIGRRFPVDQGAHRHRSVCRRDHVWSGAPVMRRAGSMGLKKENPARVDACGVRAYQRSPVTRSLQLA